MKGIEAIHDWRSNIKIIGKKPPLNKQQSIMVLQEMRGLDSDNIDENREAKHLPYQPKLASDIKQPSLFKEKNKEKKSIYYILKKIGTL